MKFPVRHAFASAIFVAAGFTIPAFAGAVIDPAFANANTLAANDDGSTALVGLGFSANFFGTTYTGAYVNNNGNLTFTGALSTFTPSGLGGVATPIIAPYFADVDTRGAGSGLVTYGSGSITLSGNTYSAFAAEYPMVGYFGSHADKLDTFEVILVSRPDTGAGNFDIYFDYNGMLWETGDASGGSGGLGGTSAAVGYSNGSGTYYQLPGSLVNGALINGGVDALISHDLNSSTLGQYIFQVRNGVVVSSTPEPGTIALIGFGFVGLAFMHRRGKAAK
jgi:hypothetical protein